MEEDAARPSAAARSSPWQEAHMDILGIVLHRANSLPDSARAAAVCRAWRRAVVHLHPPLPPQLPWLLLPGLKLCSLSSDGSTAAAHRLPQPDGALPICVGSTGDGRVIFFKDERRCFFLNPLSGATSSLPDFHLDAKLQTTLSAFGGVEAAYPRSSLYVSSPPRKVIVMPCSPDSGSPCIVAGIRGHATLFLSRPGAATWTVITVHRLSPRSQSDIAFHNGKLYLFNTSVDPRFLAFDVREDAKGVLGVAVATPFPGPPSPHGDGAVPGADSAIYYLTESSRGRLLLVRRDVSHMERRTRAVTVFALDESTGRPEWERMESLGGEIIFLSATSSVSVPSSRHRGARGDRVYFSQEKDVMVEGCPRQKGVWHCLHQHCEVFDMRTRAAETLCTGTTPGHERWCYGPTWFVPSQPKHTNAN